MRELILKPRDLRAEKEAKIMAVIVSANLVAVLVAFMVGV